MIGRGDYAECRFFQPEADWAFKYRENLSDDISPSIVAASNGNHAYQYVIALPQFHGPVYSVTPRAMEIEIPQSCRGFTLTNRLVKEGWKKSMIIFFLIRTNGVTNW
jgi:hypothetical protein